MLHGVDVCFGVVHHGRLACIEICCTALVAAMCCCFLVKQMERGVSLLLSDYTSAAFWCMIGFCRCLLTLCWCAGSALWKCFCILRIAAQTCWSGVQDWQNIMQGPQTQNDMFPAPPTPLCDALVVQHVCSVSGYCETLKLYCWEVSSFWGWHFQGCTASYCGPVTNVCFCLNVSASSFHIYVSDGEITLLKYLLCLTFWIVVKQMHVVEL